MPPVGFEPTISAGERPQTYALDRVAFGTGYRNRYLSLIMYRVNQEGRSVFREVTVSVIVRKMFTCTGV